MSWLPQTHTIWGGKSMSIFKNQTEKYKSWPAQNIGLPKNASLSPTCKRDFDFKNLRTYNRGVCRKRPLSSLFSILRVNNVLAFKILHTFVCFYRFFFLSWFIKSLRSKQCKNWSTFLCIPRACNRARTPTHHPACFCYQFSED